MSGLHLILLVALSIACATFAWRPIAQQGVKTSLPIRFQSSSRLNSFQPMLQDEVRDYTHYTTLYHTIAHYTHYTTLYTLYRTIHTIPPYTTLYSILCAFASRFSGIRVLPFLSIPFLQSGQFGSRRRLVIIMNAHTIPLYQCTLEVVFLDDVGLPLVLGDVVFIAFHCNGIKMDLHR